ncbi:GNAT family N-acetyltransferase [Terrarubrum flagellatum]|uniref:GNAT family N-acetyltransferase n=1 Tax=Terrirubrum flagellatum TaxID=2895980 RepID=UPI003144FA09
MKLDDILLRPMARADLDALVALYRDDVLGRAREADDGEDQALYVAAFDRVASDPSTTVYVAETDGALVGTFQLTITPGVSQRGVIRATIESVRTRADLRGRGVGARMMDFAVAEARRRGADVVQLTSNLSRKDAHRFYERLGFSQSHAGFKLDLKAR